MSKIPGVLLALALAWGGGRLEAQVTVVRTLPPSSAPEVPAQWSAPRPDAQAALAAGRPQLSGRVSLGGSAGSDAAGTPTYGFFTDSQVRLIQPLGPVSTLQIAGKAVRKNVLAGVQQDYQGELGLVSERFALDAAGNFKQSEASATEAAIKATASTTIMPTLPVSLSYLHNWTQGEEQTESANPAQLDSVKLSSAGTLGRLGIEISGTLDNGADTEKNLKTLGTGGKVQLEVPALPFLSILARFSPNYTRTEYTSTGGATVSTSLESNLGLLFPLSDAVQLTVLAGRVDTWPESQGLPEALPPYQVTWEGELGAEVKDLAGFSAAPAYRIAKTVGGTLLNSLSLAGGWTPAQEGLLSDVHAAGEFLLTTSENGSLLENKDTWNAAVRLTPAEKMNLTASYSGSYDGGPAVLPGWRWDHKGNAQLSHEPDPLLDYKASASLSAQSTAEADTLTQEYAAGLNLKPQWDFRQLLFGLTETLSIVSAALSKASYVMIIPITTAVKARYCLDWEWINRTAPGEGAGNNLRHLAGIAVEGETVPVSLSVEYALSHGYRGLRNDFNAGLRLPFAARFTLESSVAFSGFREGGVWRFPFLLSLAVANEF